MIRARTDRFVLLTATLSSLIYLAASGDAATMIPVLLGLACARLITGEAGSGRNLPTGLISLAVIGVMSVILVVALVRGFDIELFSRLIALLMTLKAFERRGARDLSQVLMLAVFLLIGSLLTDSGLLVGLGLVVLVPFVVTSSMLLQMLVASEQARVPQSRLTPAGRRSFRRTVSLLVSLGFVGAVTMFLLIPRGLAEQVFGRLGQVSVGEPVSGFSDEINLDLDGTITDSQTPVLDLQVIKWDGTQLGSEGKTFYLRGAVLDRYENRKWKPSTSRETDTVDAFEAGRLSSFASSAHSAGAANRWTMEQRIIIRNVVGDRTYVFGSWEPVGVWFDRDTTIRTRRDMGTARFDYSMGKVGYTIRVLNRLDQDDLPTLQRRNSPEVDSPDTSARPLRRPISFPSEAVHDYAVALLEDAQIDADPLTRPIADDHRAATVFMNHLRLQFRYTLTPTAPRSSDDPVEWFLTEHKEGHCEVFASAMAAMCRSVGIDARVITGYLATEFNDLTGYYTVRESNAHAWVEVQVVPGRTGVDPGVWETFDPTPQGSLWSVHEPKGGLLARAKRLFETAEFAWINSVIGFGADSQKAVIGTVELPRFMQNIPRQAENRINVGGRRLIAVAFGLGVASFAGAILLMTLAKLALALLLKGLGRPKIRWRSRSRRPIPTGLRGQGLERVYTRLLRSLIKRGIAKPPEVPLRRHLETRGDGLEPSARAAYLDAATILYEAQFSTREISPERREALDRAVREAVAGA